MTRHVKDLVNPSPATGSCKASLPHVTRQEAQLKVFFENPCLQQLRSFDRLSCSLVRHADAILRWVMLGALMGRHIIGS